MKSSTIRKSGLISRYFNFKPFAKVVQILLSIIKDSINLECKGIILGKQEEQFAKNALKPQNNHILNNYFNFKCLKIIRFFSAKVKI